MIIYLCLGDWTDFRGDSQNDVVSFVSSDRGFWYNRFYNVIAIF